MILPYHHRHCCHCPESGKESGCDPQRSWPSETRSAEQQDELELVDDPAVLDQKRLDIGVSPRLAPRLRDRRQDVLGKGRPPALGIPGATLQVAPGDQGMQGEAGLAGPAAMIEPLRGQGRREDGSVGNLVDHLLCRALAPAFDVVAVPPLQRGADETGQRAGRGDLECGIPALFQRSDPCVDGLRLFREPVLEIARLRRDDPAAGVFLPAAIDEGGGMMLDLTSGKARLGFGVTAGLIGFFLFFPVYWLVISAFKTNEELYRIIPTVYPHRISLEHFRFALTEGGLLRQGVHDELDEILDMALHGVGRISELEERERKAIKRGEAHESSLLDDVPRALPALSRAEKLTRRAATVGFDWSDMTEVTDKVREELAETEHAISENDSAKVQEEIGDLLFAVVNLARKAGIQPEAALSDANAKFSRRFRYIEKRCAEDRRDIATAGLAILDSYWNEIRATERSGGGVLPADDEIGIAVEKG